jgi:anti-sigma regulatory factor (Ser/Thr protein kinase)
MGQHPRTVEIHNFLLENIESYPKGILDLTAQKFHISKPAVSQHLKRLIEKGALNAVGNTAARKFYLKDIEEIKLRYELPNAPSEDEIWREALSAKLSTYAPQNVLTICQHGFTEMFNNVLDHSSAKTVTVNIRITAAIIHIWIHDDGIGIFKKIQTDFKLQDIRQALLELAKGKLTSDPTKHSGEGIFFTSRMFDRYVLASDNIAYIRTDEDDWLIEERDPGPHDGTTVSMKIMRKSTKTSSDVYKKFASEENDYGFTRTHVPVELARYEGEELISRSQAKRLLQRFERFREVFLDFKGVTMIGQPFADEIFRVFRNANPGIRLVYVNADPKVENMIKHVESGMDSPPARPA